MLQNDPVRSLGFDSDIRVAQQGRSESNAYFDGPYNITSQLRYPVQTNSVNPRIPLPITTVAQNVKGSHTYIPLVGYDILADVPSIHIEQTFELNESLTAVSSENRYVVRSTLGEAIFSAIESSTQNHRLLWGASRPFQMHLLDRTHQEAMVFRKKFRLGSFCCQPNSLEVWIPPGNLLGRIVQSPTFVRPEFYIEDGESGQPMFCLEGPKKAGFCCFSLSSESFFKIHSGDELRASIDHKWMATKSQYTTNIYFSDSKLTAKERALILGAAILLEYTFFQKRI